MRRMIPFLFAALATAAAGTAAAEPLVGSWWYAVDHVTEVQPGARVVLWATLPAQWHGQDVKVTGIDPAPVAVLEDDHSGNRVAEWVIEPEPGATGQFFVHYDFQLEEKPLQGVVDPAAIKPYDRSSALYRKYTEPETWIQTEGRVLDQARRIVGKETDPWRQARLVYDWLRKNVAYTGPAGPEYDAESVMLAGRGDCARIGILMTAMLRSLGIPARTVTCAFTTGGDHVFTEFWLEGVGWVPADAALGQMLDPAREGRTSDAIRRILDGHNLDRRDPGWLLGNLFDGRLVCTVGNNIRFDSPTLGHPVVLQRMEPGGGDATPAGIEIAGLNRDIVHGGFWVFGRRLADEEEAHAVTHQKLADSYFKTGLYDVVDDVCLQSVSAYDGGVQSWINMGKVYLHKGDYYKAEAAFRKAQHDAADARRPQHDPLAWTHNYLGNCYDLMGQREMALQEYQATIRLGNNFRGAMDYAKTYLEKPFSRSQ